MIILASVRLMIYVRLFRMIKHMWMTGHTVKGDRMTKAIGNELIAPRLIGVASTEMTDPAQHLSRKLHNNKTKSTLR
jgi:hypothetical protein